MNSVPEQEDHKAAYKAGAEVPDDRPDSISVEHVLTVYNAPGYPIPPCETADECPGRSEWVVRVSKTDDGESWVLCDTHMVEVVRENRRWEQ